MNNFTDFWCFKLNVLSRKISKLYNNQCLEFGVTATQSFVIFDLLDYEGTSVKDIAKRIQLDSPAVTGLIDRLVKEDLVRRVDDPSDRRSLQIYLSTKGRELAKKLLPIAQKFNQHIKGVLSSEEEKNFEKLLYHLQEKL